MIYPIGTRECQFSHGLITGRNLTIRNAIAIGNAKAVKSAYYFAV